MCANCIKRKEAGADFFAYMSIIYRFLNFYSYIIAGCFKNKKNSCFRKVALIHKIAQSLTLYRLSRADAWGRVGILAGAHKKACKAGALKM